MDRSNECSFEPNALCDSEHGCLECLKQEKRWAAHWVATSLEVVEERFRVEGGL